jgi:hypothetical protein
MKKRIFVFSVLVFAVALFAQTDRTPQDMMANIIQPTKSISGDTIKANYTSGVYTIPSRKWAKGAELRINATNGYLSVHLVSDPAGRYYKMPLLNGERTGAMFDQVDSAHTTVTIDSVTIFIKEDY